MCDKLVFDISQESETAVSPFVRKDWLNVIDSNNQNYSSNELRLDSSSICNSNKWQNYRESWFFVPMVLALTSNTPITTGIPNNDCIGLKNWFGTIFHNLQVIYNGTTICQQIPLSSLWNVFKLHVTLSWQDVQNLGPTIGFYPDDPSAFTFNNGVIAAGTSSGMGVCNNVSSPYASALYANSGSLVQSKAGIGNIGHIMRMKNIVYDPTGYVGVNAAGAITFSTLQTPTNCNTLWKSYVLSKAAGVAGTSPMYYFCAINAVVYLKHLHDVFDKMPLLKGVYLQFILTLNNASCQLTTTTTAAGVPGTITVSSVNVPSSGVNPLLVSSTSYIMPDAAQLGASIITAAAAATINPVPSGTSCCYAGNYTASISVGSKPLVQSQLIGNGYTNSQSSCYLYIPVYTFSPIYESAYLSSPIKQIVYEDIYQNQVLNIIGGASFNSLITNGYANLTSILIIPTFSPATGGLPAGAQVPQFQSPFDTCGGGTTAPLVQFSNFNVVVSGQNASYSQIRYNADAFVDQVYGLRSVNGNMTDGVGSGLINYTGWSQSQCYYYLDISRCLEVEKMVPKSVYIQGTNSSGFSVDLYVFLTYNMSISVDVLSGARV